MMNTKTVISALTITGLALFFISPFNVHAEPSDLIAHYSLDEGSGLIANDVTGNSANGTLTNGPAWTTGKIGFSALSFDGVNDAVYSYSPAFEFGTSSFSVSVWIYNQNDIGTIISKRETYNLSAGWSMEQMGSWIQFVFDGGNDGGSVAFNYSRPLNTWIHAVAVVDRNTNVASLYLDGVLKAQSNMTGVVNLSSSSYLILGYWKAKTAFLGSLDDVRIYNRALSASEVSSVYNIVGVEAPSDLQAPSIPGNINISDVAQTSMSLSWASSTDNIAVTGYNLFKDGVFLANTTTNSYSVSGLTASTTYQFSVTARDFAGNISATSTVYAVTLPVPVDNTAPIIGNQSVSSVTSSGANISWVTDEVSDTQVFYGTTTDYGLSTALNDSFVNNHSQSLSNLSASTTYFYKVVSKDAAGNTASSSASFITASVPSIGFFWSMESETPDFTGGTDITPYYYAQAYRSTDFAKDGQYSLKNTGFWASATFDNPTNNDVWAPVTEGTVEFDWKYVGPWGTRMLFQMTGKCTYDRTACYGLDTNDGVGVRTKGNKPGVFIIGGINSSAVNMVEGKWYHVRLRYSVSLGVLTVDFDGNTIITIPYGMPQFGAKAWHQILIGNDNGVDATQYIDNFGVYPTWKP